MSVRSSTAEQGSLKPVVVGSSPTVRANFLFDTLLKNVYSAVIMTDT